MKPGFYFYLFLSLISLNGLSQSVAINTDGSTANASALLDVKSTNRGILIPRMTLAQRNLISLPATGLLIYQTDNTTGYYSNTGTPAVPSWQRLAEAGNLYWTFNTPHIYNSNAGNVGLGATIPGEKLEVNGNIRLTNTGSIYTAPGNTSLTVRAGDGTGTGGVMTIRAGNAGVPSGGAGGNLILQAGANMPAGGAGYGGLGAPGIINILGSYGYNSVGGGINIVAGASSCWSLVSGSHSDVTIQGGQNFASTDASSIVVEGGYTLGCGGNAHGGNLILRSGIAAGTGTPGNFQLLNGNVGIGTSAPSSKLEVCGNVRVVGTIVASGTITTSAISCPSDLRYKKNIRPLTNNVQKLLRLQGVTYSWKQEEFPNMQFNDRPQIGFIAQEVEKLFPEMVFTDAAGFKSIDYARLTPVLVETIKEQDKKIANICKRLALLEKRR